MLLLLSAAGTALSMALLSPIFGFAIVGRAIGRNFERVISVLGVFGMTSLPCCKL
ncbi:MAG: hypothetical protein M3305_10730 [Actinomycetota bacterium]|nr:hypothetical protein [Actinomycetota bacterium]